MAGGEDAFTVTIANGPAGQNGLVRADIRLTPRLRSILETYCREEFLNMSNKFSGERFDPNPPDGGDAQ